MKKDTKQRLLEIMKKVDPSFKPKLNEDSPYNDGGEPTMTHQQYRDDIEHDSDYDEIDGNDYEPQQTQKSINNNIEKHFNTLVYCAGNNCEILTKDIDGLEIVFNNNMVSASAHVNGQVKEFPEQNLSDLNVQDLIEFFEPYRQYILTGSEAEKRMNQIYQQDANDRQYSNQERSAMGGGF